MKVSITGGCGYFGSNLANHLSANKYKVKVLTRNKKNKLHNPNILTEEISWKNEVSILKALKNSDAIVHMAGMNSINSMKNPSAAIDFRENSIKLILKACRKYKIPKVIFISSAHVYGHDMKGFINEKTLRKINSPYSESLINAENILFDSMLKQDSNIVILRCSNGYGSPVMESKECWNLVLNEICLKASKNETIMIKNPYAQRNFIPISESCRAVEFFLNTDLKLNEAYNVGSKETFTLEEIIELIRRRAYKTFSKNLNIIYPVYLEKENENENFIYSTKKLTDLGFNFKYNHKKELDKLLHFCNKIL